MTRPGLSTRVDGRAAQRDRWGLVVTDARGAGEAGALAIGELARSARALSARTFPLGDASAQLLAGGFLDQVHALHAAGTPERRALIAPVVEGAARALDTLIHEARQKLAEGHWTARTGIGGRGMTAAQLSPAEARYYRDYGAWVARERRRVGFSQVDLGQLTGLHPSTIGAIEGGTQRVFHHHHLALERVFAERHVEGGSALQRTVASPAWRG